jgi:uncharacterized protein (DUF2236 family)
MRRERADSLLPPPGEWRALTPRPATITWRRASDARVSLAAGYALLLQVSHPTVGAGVSEHSQFRHEPWGRLLRTLDYTYTMVYGGPQAAGEMGRRIRSFHKQIRGTTPDGRRYHALEPGPYAWVHATLAEGIVRAHARFGMPFSVEQREDFWGQWRALGRLLGIREGDLPPDWRGFEDYFQEMVALTLVHTPAVDDVLGALARPSAPALPGLRDPLWALARVPLGHVLQLATVGLLAPSLRQRFGLGWSLAQESQLRALSGALRSATALMPAWLQNTSAGYLRYRSRAIARGDVASPSRLAATAT